MIGLRQFFICISVVSFAFFAVSCGGDSSSEDAEGEDVGLNNEEEIIIEDQVHIQIPTPHEMMEFINSSGGKFKAELLCSPQIYNRYVDNKGKCMGMGIYIADLAYTASYSQFQESIKYFDVLVKMSEDLGISNVFDESMMHRIKNNLDNPDSLEIISNESYYNIIAELEANDRGKMVAMMAAGGFLESLFIATQMVDKFDAKNPLMSRIASQKLVYENVMAYLDQYKDDKNVEWTINDMMALKSIFEDVSDTRRDTKFAEGSGGKRVLGGTGGVYITEQEFVELQYQASFLRNSITFNSPTPQ